MTRGVWEQAQDAKEAQYQFQNWDAVARAYVPCEPTARGRAWRWCKPERALKPRYLAPRGIQVTRTIEQVRAAYFEWAIAHQVYTVTDYERYRYQDLSYCVSRRFVDAESYFTVTTETIGELTHTQEAA